MGIVTYTGPAAQITLSTGQVVTVQSGINYTFPDVDCTSLLAEYPTRFAAGDSHTATLLPVTYADDVPLGSFAKAAYSSTVTYMRGQVVNSGGAQFICLTDGTVGLDPATNPSNWLAQTSGAVVVKNAANVFTAGGQAINPAAAGDSALTVTMPASFTGIGVSAKGPIDGSGSGSLVALDLYGTGNGLDVKGWTPNATGGVTNGGIPLAVHQYGSPPTGGCAVRFDNCGTGAGLILANTENSNNAPTTWGNGSALQWNTYNGYTTFTGATVTGNNTVSDVANAPFLPNCVGKPIIVAGVKTTIATYVSASQVTTVSNALVNGSANVTYSLPLKANVGLLAYMTLDPVPRSIGGGGFLTFVNAQTGTHGRSADPWSFVNSLDSGASALYVEQALGTTGASALLVNNLGNTGDLMTLQAAGTSKFRVDNNGSITRMANATMTGAGTDGNFIFGTTTGTKIGTLTTQKLAFWNATPIVQPTGTPAASTDLASVIALANSIRTNLLALGLVA